MAQGKERTQFLHLAKLKLKKLPPRLGQTPKWSVAAVAVAVAGPLGCCRTNKLTQFSGLFFRLQIVTGERLGRQLGR